MRSPRLVLTALALTLALTACSGDDSSDSDAPAGDAASQADESGEPGDATEEESEVPGEERSCRATVTVTGTVEASWKGKATVRGEEDGPSAVYLDQAGPEDGHRLRQGRGLPAVGQLLRRQAGLRDGPGHEQGSRHPAQR